MCVSGYSSRLANDLSYGSLPYALLRESICLAPYIIRYGLESQKPLVNRSYHYVALHPSFSGRSLSRRAILFAGYLPHSGRSNLPFHLAVRASVQHVAAIQGRSYHVP